jgi:DNA-binding SARP family transcriptional activator
MAARADAPGWQLVLHGRPALRRLPVLADDPADLPLGAMDAALLALVALDGPLPRARLAAWLWPQASPGAALGNLRQRLHRLQRRCGDALLLSQGDQLALGPLVQLQPADAGAAAGLGADGDILGAHDYRHLPQLQAWVEAHRSRWRTHQQARLAQAVAQHQANGDLAGAVHLVQAARAAQPLDEHLTRQLMRLHHAQGDQLALQRAYDRCADALRRELGVQPSTETMALHQQLLLSPPAPAATAPASALSPAAQALLHLAAVAGDRLGVALAERALGCPALQLVAPWLELQDAGWFDSHGPVQGPALQALRERLPRPILAHLQAWVAAQADGAAPAPAGACHACHAGVTPGATRPA